MVFQKKKKFKCLFLVHIQYFHNAICSRYVLGKCGVTPRTNMEYQQNTCLHHNKVENYVKFISVSSRAFHEKLTAICINHFFSSHEQEFGKGFSNTFVVFSQCLISIGMDKRIKTTLQNDTGRKTVYVVLLGHFAYV